MKQSRWLFLKGTFCRQKNYLQVGAEKFHATWSWNSGRWSCSASLKHAEQGTYESVGSEVCFSLVETNLIGQHTSRIDCASSGVACEKESTLSLVTCVDRDSIEKR